MKEKNPSSNHKQPLTTWSEKWLAGGRSYRAAKWSVPTGRANSLQDVQLHTDRWRCDPHTCTARNTMPVEWTIHRRYTNLAADSISPFPPLQYWNKRWSLKPGLHDFPSCRIGTHNLLHIMALQQLLSCTLY